MGKRTNGRRRGEGNTEYVVLLMFVIICAVVGLFTSYSGTIKKMQLEKGLCLDCTNRDGVVTPKAGSTADSNTTSTPPPPAPNPNLPTANSSLGSDPSTNDWWSAFKDFLSWW